MNKSYYSCLIKLTAGLPKKKIIKNYGIFPFYAGWLGSCLASFQFPSAYFIGLNIFKNVRVIKNRDKTTHKSKRILCSQFMD